MIAIAPASSMCRSKSFHCSWIDLLSGGGLLTTFTAVAASLARTRARCFQAPLIGDTIGVYFDKSAARWPDRPALIVRQQNVRWTYGELKERVDAFAAGLLALGLAPGDRIGIWSPNNAEWVITQFATAKAGLILVTSTPRIGHTRSSTRSTRWGVRR